MNRYLTAFTSLFVWNEKKILRPLTKVHLYYDPTHHITYIRTRILYWSWEKHIVCYWYFVVRTRESFPCTFRIRILAGSFQRMCSLHLSVFFFTFLDSHPVPAAPTTHMQVVFPCLPWFDLTCHVFKTLGWVKSKLKKARAWLAAPLLSLSDLDHWRRWRWGRERAEAAERLPTATGLALVCTKVKPGAEVAETNDQAVTAVWASKRALPAIGWAKVHEASKISANDLETITALRST